MKHLSSISISFLLLNLSDLLRNCVLTSKESSYVMALLLLISVIIVIYLCIEIQLLTYEPCLCSQTSMLILTRIFSGIPYEVMCYRCFVAALHIILLQTSIPKAGLVPATLDFLCIVHHLHPSRCWRIWPK